MYDKTYYKYYFPVIVLSLLYLCLICSCKGTIVESQVAPAEKIIGVWRCANLTVNSQRGSRTIAIDTNYTELTFHEITVIKKDTILFYVADSFYTPSGAGALEYRTLYTSNLYSCISDSLVFFSSFIDIRGRVGFNRDTMIFYYKLDSQNPMATQYGEGTLKRKYVPYTGAVPPAGWPPIF